MNEHEQLNALLAQAILAAQARDRSPTRAAKDAAKAFAAGLAAFENTPKSEDQNARYLREAAAARNAGGAIGVAGGAIGQVPENYVSAVAARMATPSSATGFE